LFEIDTNRLPLPATASGYAGFRLEYSPASFGEVTAFLDATYFRMIGRGQSYGASARGLAIDTTSTQPEEFPIFKQFWVERPGRSDMEISLFALLDSPSVSGAYHFVIHPGSITTAKVQATLFPRVQIKQLGLAPLTSMFLYDENSKPPYGDYRPEVHDSDGLLIHNGHDEWIWRPLETKKRLRDNTFWDENPLGFGLMQRQRNFTKYQDPEARYEDRPSVWIQPHGKWGKGAVELIQLPSGKEAADNIVAFWTPAAPLKAGGRIDLEYEMSWMNSDPEPPTLGRVLATRFGRIVNKSADWGISVDFAAPLTEAASPQLQPEIAFCPDVQGVSTNLFKVPETGVWRLVMEIVEPKQTVEMRAFLKNGERPLTETWTFTWHPDDLIGPAQ